MSHYAVGIITENKINTEEELVDILEPFNENLEVPKYLYKTKAELIDLAKETKRVVLERIAEDPAQKENWMDKYLEATTDEEFYNCEYDENFSEAYDKEGNLYSTYNPKSKWDWWMIGGRFSNILDGEMQSTVGYLKKLNNSLPKDLSEEELKEKYKEEYKNYQILITEGDFYKEEYYQQKYPTFKDFILTRLTQSTYAVLTPEGEWLEPGTMGWFGMSNASIEDERNWPEKFNEILNKYPDNYWITVVDCHI